MGLQAGKLCAQPANSSIEISGALLSGQDLAAILRIFFLGFLLCRLFLGPVLVRKVRGGSLGFQLCLFVAGRVLVPAVPLDAGHSGQRQQ